MGVLNQGIKKARREESGDLEGLNTMGEQVSLANEREYESHA